MGTPALQVRKPRLRCKITGSGYHRRNCWGKAGFFILPWLSSKVRPPGLGPADAQSDHSPGFPPTHMELGWTHATESVHPRPRQRVPVPAFGHRQRFRKGLWERRFYFLLQRLLLATVQALKTRQPGQSELGHEQEQWRSLCVSRAGFGLRT